MTTRERVEFVILKYLCSVSSATLRQIADVVANDPRSCFADCNSDDIAISLVNRGVARLVEEDGTVRFAITIEGCRRLQDGAERRSSSALDGVWSRFYPDGIPRSRPSRSSEDDEWDDDEEEAVATACISEPAMDAWWASLTIDQKSDAMVNHFEVQAALEHRFDLTAAGKAALTEVRELKPACRIPPPGWSCTRGEGHKGPCAAVPHGAPWETYFEKAQAVVAEEKH